MNNEFSLLSDMQQDCKLYGMVELDQLRSMWKPRKYPIEVAVSLVQSGLLPSIFDWALIGQLMPAEQSLGEMMLQQRINDLELLSSLTTSLQRIQILPESGVEVDVVMGRPSYNVQVQADGKIVVKELPSVQIHIYAVEPRAAAGQEGGQEQEQKNSDVEDIKANKAEAQAETEAETEQDEAAGGGADNDNDADADVDADADADDTDTETKTEAEEIMCLDELNATTMTMETTTATTTTITTTTASTDPEEEQHRMIKEPTSEEEGVRVGGGAGNPSSNPTEDFLPFFEDSATLTDVEDPSDYLSEYEEPVDVKLHRRMSFWMRFGNWLRQSMPRLT